MISVHLVVDLLLVAILDEISPLASIVASFVPSPCISVTPMYEKTKEDVSFV
jgi:hypothetical protein